MKPLTIRLPNRPPIVLTTPADVRALDYRTREDCALAIAMNCKTHAEAIRRIMALGLAQDAGEADALIYEAEERNQ